MNTTATTTVISSKTELLKNLERTMKDTSKQINRLRGEIHLAERTTAKTKAELKEERKAARVARYTPHNGVTMEVLRAAGYRVRVTHMRFTTAPNVPVAFEVPSFLRKFYTFESKGGSTHIVLTRKDGKQISLTSVCNREDAFDYKMGTKIALSSLEAELSKEIVAAAARANEKPVEEPVTTVKTTK